MTAQGSLQLGLYLALLVLAAKPLGLLMTAVYEGRRTWLTPVFGWLERGIYRVAGIDNRTEMDWRRYAVAVLVVNVIGFAVVYLLQRLQGVLPLEPAGLCGRQPRFVVQHGRELRDEHELAGLRRRIDDELSHADARPRRAEFLVGRDGYGRARRADPWLRAA